jgi:hypothetical protein
MAGTGQDGFAAHHAIIPCPDQDMSHRVAGGSSREAVMNRAVTVKKGWRREKASGIMSYVFIFADRNAITIRADFREISSHDATCQSLFYIKPSLLWG